MHLQTCSRITNDLEQQGDRDMRIRMYVGALTVLALAGIMAAHAPASAQSPGRAWFDLASAPSVSESTAFNQCDVGLAAAFDAAFDTWTLEASPFEQLPPGCRIICFKPHGCEFCQICYESCY